MNAKVGCIYPLSLTRLLQDNRRYRGTKAVSDGNRADGFRPAFLDSDTNKVYLSRRADGRLAAVHCLEGLPAGLILRRDKAGRVMETKPGLIAGFSRADHFYSREEALELLQQR